MRIITGRARGTKLVTLEGDATRPTAERTKEALFSVLRFELPGARVLDLFAGSGQLGLEAISQGAIRAVLCDSSRRAVDVLHANAEKTHFLNECEIICADWEMALRRFVGREQFDVVFLDPPYAAVLLPRVLSALADGGLLSNGARVVCESAEENDVFCGDMLLRARYEVLRTARYGAACVTILTQKEADV